MLLFRVDGKTINLLPGGKVKHGETSYNSLVRELSEELNFYEENMDITYLALCEEFVKDTNDNLSHHINIIYKGLINKNQFKGNEGPWINFEWVDIDKLDKYRLHPRNIKEMALNLNRIYHIIEDLRD